MAVIQPYQQQVAPQGSLNVQATPNEFGANVGAALQNVGSAGMAMAETLYQNENQAEVTNAHVELAKKRALWAQKLVEMENATKPGDETFVPRVMTGVRSDLDTLGEQFRTRAGQQTFARMSADMTSMFGQQAIAIQAKLNGEFAKNQYNDLANSLGTVAIQDHTQIESLLSQGRAAIDDPNGRFARVPESTREAFRNDIDNHLKFAAAQGFARRYPNAVLASVPDTIRNVVRDVVANPPAPGQSPDLGGTEVRPISPTTVNSAARQVAQASPYDDAFKAAANLYNLDWRELKMRALAGSGAMAGNAGDVRDVVWNAEGGAAQSPVSSARGGGILDSTWNSWAARLGLDPKLRGTREGFDRVWEAYQADARRVIGRDLTGAEQYLAWFLGPAGAKAFLFADRNADARQLYGQAAGDTVAEEAFRTNGKFLKPGMTVGQVIDTLNEHYAKFGGNSGPGNAVPATALRFNVDPANPQQSIMDNARQLSELKAKAGGDMSRTDLMSYGGENEASWGPDAWQYAANLAALRQTVGLGSQVPPEAFAPAASTQVASSQDWKKSRTGIGFIDSLPADKFFKVLTQAEHYQRAYDTQSERARLDREREEKKVRESVMNAYLNRIINPNDENGGELGEVEIMDNKVLHYSEKKALIEYRFQRARELAAQAEPKTNPAEVRRLMLLIHAADDDPIKTYNMDPIMESYKEGRISTLEMQMLRKEVEQLRDGTTNGFQKDVQHARNAVFTALTRSILGQAQPEVAADAAYRFNADMEQQIARLRKENKDPRVLLDPASPDYLLRPERIQSFMQSSASALGDAARKATDAERSQLPTYKDFDTLPKGARFIDPQGNVRVKP